MTAIGISAPSDDPRQRTQAVLQVIAGSLSGRAGRISGLQSGDIGELENAQELLQANSSAWVQAEDWFVVIVYSIATKWWGSSNEQLLTTREPVFAANTASYVSG